MDDTALRLNRGITVLFGDLGLAALSEFPLPNGRRADLVAIDDRGEIVIVEIKSSRTDFVSDRKWWEYREFCDRFYFAKPPELDPDIFPVSEGLIVADAHDAAILRSGPDLPLSPPRRKAMLLQLARLGADRVHTLMDPDPGQPT